MKKYRTIFYNFVQENYWPILCNFGLIVWGIQTGFWAASVLIILILEGRWFIKKRFRATELLSFTTLFLNLLIILFLFSFGLKMTDAYIRLLPISTFFLVFLQSYSSDFQQTFNQIFRPFYFFRRYVQNDSLTVYPFFFISCILASASEQSNGYLFLGLTTFLVAGVILRYRSLRFKKATTIGLLILTLGVSVAGASQIYHLKTEMTQMLATMLPQKNQSGLALKSLDQNDSLQFSEIDNVNNTNRRPTGNAIDPERSVPRFNQLRSAKRSNQILLRVGAEFPETNQSSLFPLHLRVATYNQFQSETWIAKNSQFQGFFHTPMRSQRWIINPSNQSLQSNNDIRISEKLTKGRGMLKVPLGTFEIDHLPVNELETNQYGSVRVRGKPGAITYNAQFNPSNTDDSLPSEADLDVPVAEQSALQQVLDTLDLPGKSDAEIVSTLSTFFDHGFQYSLEPTQASFEKTPLETFLLGHRTGHCEYYGTATTLLLRQAGIPARYVVGYYAHEYSPLERQYIVRQSHAHAWSMAFVGGQWQELDNTPSAWPSIEDERIDSWQAIADFLSYLTFQASILMSRYPWILWIGTAIIAFIIFKLWKIALKRLRRLWQSLLKSLKRSLPLPKAEPTISNDIDAQGLDSEYYLIEARLLELKFERHTGETVEQWLRRSQTMFPNLPLSDLDQVTQLHYRHRFDPQGLTILERKQLNALSHQILEQLV